jgi:elongation factor P
MANISLRRGMLIRHQNHIYEVVSFQEHHAGKQKPTVHVALRDVRDGRPVDRNLDDITPIEQVDHAYRRVQYLYARGPTLVFMDSESFEEIELPADRLGSQAAFLVEGSEYRGVLIDGALTAVEVPDIVSIQVKLTAPAEHSVGAASNITKEAILENGLEVRVPLFIKTGDPIRVDTRTKAYAGKDHG